MLQCNTIIGVDDFKNIITGDKTAIIINYFKCLELNSEILFDRCDLSRMTPSYL